MSQEPTYEFARVGSPVYRNPINMGNVRPTIKQRLGPINYKNIIRVGVPPQNPAFRPFGHRGRGRGRGHQSRYAWTARNNEHAEAHRVPVAERLGSLPHAASIKQGSSHSNHGSSSSSHADKYKSRSKSHDQRHKSTSSHRTRDRTPTRSQDRSGRDRECSEEDEASSIVISRDLRVGKRRVQYDDKLLRGAAKDNEGKDKESSKFSHSRVWADSNKEDNDEEKSNSKSSPETKSANSGIISKLVGAIPSKEPVMVIESISGESSPDEKEDEEDVEVLQLRREALEAMMKNLDEAHSPDSKETNNEASNAVANVSKATAVSSGSTAAASDPTASTETNMDIDEKSLREKLLVDMSRKRKLTNSNDSKQSDCSTDHNVPCKKHADKTIGPSPKPAPKHSPIKFPSPAASTVKPATKYFNLRDTMRYKPSLVVAPTFVSTAPSSRSQTSSKSVNNSPNRFFSRNFRYEKDMGTLRITIPNTTNKIVPINVPSTDEEDSSESHSYTGSDSEESGDFNQKSAVTPNTFGYGTQNRWPTFTGTQSTSAAELRFTTEGSVLPARPPDDQVWQFKFTPPTGMPSFNSSGGLEAPVISPEQLPESFQRKLAQLLSDAKEDSKRPEETKTESEKQKKEKMLQDLRKQAERIAEEEELLRQEKNQLAYLKAERSRRLLHKAKAAVLQKNVQATASPKVASHGKPTTGNQPDKSPGAAPAKAVSAVKSKSPQPFDAKSSFQALKHLPIHKQVEYIRLQSQILEHEHKLSEARFSLGLSEVRGMAPEAADVVIRKPGRKETTEDDSDFQPSDANSSAEGHATSENVANSNEDPNSEANEIEALSQRERFLRAKIIENMEKSQNHLALKAKENELINARKAACDAMNVLISATLKRGHSKLACRHLEEKITLLQYHLKVATDSLREEQCRLDASTSAIEHATSQTKEMKNQCQALEKACDELGKKAKGSDYTITKSGSNEIKLKEAEAERASKIGAPLPKKAKVVGSPRTPIQLFRLKALARARAVKRQQSYNWRKTSTPSKKKRNSLTEAGVSPSCFGCLGKTDSEDEEEIFILPRHTFTNVLIKKKPKVEQKKRKIGMSKYEEYLSPLRLVKGEDNGFLEQQMTGMVIEKLHPAVTLCTFELRAFCNSEACSFQHLYRPSSHFSFP